MRVLEDLRWLAVPAAPAPLNVLHDERTIIVPDSDRHIGNPDNEDPA
ncbi:hypothetical protein HED48_23700 [Ochrobactrum intermedium]|nr:hypothetical protein [Brucella intermedia]